MVHVHGISLPTLRRRRTLPTGAEHRLALARSVRAAIRGADPRYLPSASPLNRGAVRVEAEALEAIASRLEALDREVASRGVALVERLLMDGSSPLYGDWDADRLGEQLDEVFDALERRRP